MTDDEINAEMVAMQEQMQAEQEAEIREAGDANREAGAAYLGNAGVKACKQAKWSPVPRGS